MRNRFILLLCLSLLLVVPVYAQHYMGGGAGFMFPDTLSQITVTGKITIDSNHVMSLYYIDTNNNGEADYLLNFGPYWYSPDSSVVRPKTGDEVTINGRLNEMGMFGTPMIIVYKINDQLWRDSFDPMWNNFGEGTHMMGQHAGGCSGYVYGPITDSAQSVALTGKALVDTTYFMNMYYLDTDNDGRPDYFLNFGPWWYEPESGVERPNDGETINITGGKLSSANLPVIIIYNLNGNEWRDSTLIGKYYGGMWINKNHDNYTIMNPFDEDDFMTPGQGWTMRMGGMGGMMSDSSFGRMMELNPVNIPNSAGENIFKGYEFGIFNANGSNGMMQNGNCGGMMNFSSNGNFHFHFNDMMLKAYGMDANSIKVKYWNQQNGKWSTVSNAVVDRSENVVSFSMSGLSSYYILTADKITGVTENKAVPDGYSLEQNYPNPFNPETTISYSLLSENLHAPPQQVVLKVYDILGNEVATLVNKEQMAGKYSVKFNAVNLPSGIYFYQLKAGNFTDTKKLLLIK